MMRAMSLRRALVIVALVIVAGWLTTIPATDGTHWLFMTGGDGGDRRWTLLLAAGLLTGAWYLLRPGDFRRL